MGPRVASAGSCGLCAGDARSPACRRGRRQPAAPLGPEVLGFADLPPRLTFTCLRPLTDGSGRGGHSSGSNGLCQRSQRRPQPRSHSAIHLPLGGRSEPALLCETEEQSATRPEVLATAPSTGPAAASPLRPGDRWVTPGAPLRLPPARVGLKSWVEGSFYCSGVQPHNAKLSNVRT